MEETSLMLKGYFAQSKSYILYRSERTRMRAQRKSICSLFSDGEALEKIPWLAQMTPSAEAA
ncbi:MAG: hypothetical protein R2912_04635 [Eubacteriales bacterium]